MVAIYMVLSFGWLGSPGEFLAFGWGIKYLHESRTPAQEEWHDDVPFHVDFLMDDDVLTEPALGLRLWLAASSLESAARDRDFASTSSSVCACIQGDMFSSHMPQNGGVGDVYCANDSRTETHAGSLRAKSVCVESS